jgi:integrase
LRDALMISLAYHHALRVSELIGTRWNAIDWKRADVAVNRLKGSKSNRQPPIEPASRTSTRTPCATPAASRWR